MLQNIGVILSNTIFRVPTLYVKYSEHPRWKCTRRGPEPSVGSTPVLTVDADVNFRVQVVPLNSP